MNSEWKSQKAIGGWRQEVGGGEPSRSLDNPPWIEGPGIIRSCLGCDGGVTLAENRRGGCMPYLRTTLVRQFLPKTLRWPDKKQCKINPAVLSNIGRTDFLNEKQKQGFSEPLSNCSDFSGHSCNVLGWAWYILAGVVAVFQADVESVAVTVMQSIRAPE